MKKTLSIILAILMIVTTIPMAFAADCTHPYFKSGKCISCSYECDHSNWGYDSCKTCKMKGIRPTDQSATIKWYYDESTNYLKITGVGDMPDYSDAYSLPWYNYYSRIQTVVIAEGITSVGARAFSMCSYVTSVTLPNTLTKIGSFAFSSCSNLKDIVIPSSVTTMYRDSFNYMSSDLKVHYCGASADLTVSGGSVSYLHYCEKRAGTEATCTEPGVADTWYCANCRKTVAGGEAIPASHKIVAVEAQAKTCTEAGWEAYEYCTECEYTTKVEIPASHDIATAEAQAPTCTEAGWDAYEYCTACDYTTKVEIPAIGEHIDADNDGVCDNGGEQLICPDCDRPVHEGAFNNFICKIINLFKIIYTFVMKVK